MKRRTLTAFMTAVAMTGVCTAAFAGTDHYNDSSITGSQTGWDEWVANWDATATDFTKVSLTPGKDDTELNFAWYSEKTDAAATPVVHFGTDKEALDTFEGESGDVDQDLTGDKAYEYNHVTVTGLQPNTTYYYTVEKNGEQTEPVEYTTKNTDTIKMIYVGDPQVGASKGHEISFFNLKNADNALIHRTLLKLIAPFRAALSSEQNTYTCSPFSKESNCNKTYDFISPKLLCFPISSSAF